MALVRLMLYDGNGLDGEIPYLRFCASGLIQVAAQKGRVNASLGWYARHCHTSPDFRKAGHQSSQQALAYQS